MEPDEKLGFSLAVEDGDIVVENDGLKMVSGRRNLLQALELRVLTPLGSDRFNTAYGLDTARIFSQPAGAALVREMIRLNLVRTLGTDPRVRDIREVTFPDEGAARRSRAWAVDVVIETIDGQAETLSVDVGV